jgi:peroxiredoxin family protein
METDLAIFIQSGTAQALHHALGLAITATSSGERVLIALFNEGLASWVEAHRSGAETFGSSAYVEQLEAGFRRLNVPPLPTLHKDCRQIAGGKLEVLGCSGAVELFDYDAEDLIGRSWVDDVVGLPTIWRRTSGARIVSI